MLLALGFVNPPPTNFCSSANVIVTFSPLRAFGHFILWRLPQAPPYSGLSWMKEIVDSAEARAECVCTGQATTHSKVTPKESDPEAG